MQVFQTYNVNILGASYGKANVTDKVRSLVQNGGLSIKADNQHFGDAWPGNAKALVVVYQHGFGKAQVAIVPEGEWINVGPTNQVTQGDFVQPGSLHIFGAAYGLGNVTAAVAKKVQNNSIDLHVDNNLGDHWPGHAKALTVVYQDATGIHTAVHEENQTFKVASQFGGFQQGGFQQGGFQHVQIGANGVTFQQGGFNGSNLEVLGAVFGKGVVTDKVRSFIQNGQLNIKADGSNFGDTWPGVQKSLVVVYRHGHGPAMTAIAKEGETISVGTNQQQQGFPQNQGGFRILGAAWGLKNVTEAVSQRIFNNSIDIPLDNNLLGDGWSGVQKALVIVYQETDGDIKTVVGVEGQNQNIRVQNQHDKGGFQQGGFQQGGFQQGGFQQGGFQQGGFQQGGFHQGGFQ